MKKIIILILILIPTITGATTEQTTGGNFSAKIEPANPEPNQEVVVTLNSYSIDLDRSQVSWFINNQAIKQGIGLKTHTAAVGDLGSNQVWRIVAKSQDGQTLQKIITFRPAEVDLLWQADTYVPSTYPGKALPTSESTVKMVAIPNILTTTGRRYDPKKLVYRWEKDFNFMKTQSGFGQDSFTFTSDKLFGSNKIKVTVSTVDESITAEKSVTVPIRTPFIALYQYNPLTGPIYNNLLSREINVGTGLFSIIAEPFYFNNPAIKNNQLTFDWLVDNESLQLKTPSSRQITFEGGRNKGQVNLGIKAVNSQNTLQNASYNGIIRITNNETGF